MYKKINISEITLQILNLFTSKKEQIHIRQAAQLCSCSPRSAQLALEELEKKGIIESIKKGNMKLFSTQTHSKAKRMILFAQQYKTICFFEEQPIIQDIVAQIKPHIKGIGIIFGSYVKKNQHKKSDLDIFVAGQANQEEIQKISESVGITIDLKQYSKKEFEKFTKKTDKDFLIEEIIKNHVLFLETEEYVESVFYDKNQLV